VRSCLREVMRSDKRIPAQDDDARAIVLSH